MTREEIIKAANNDFEIEAVDLRDELDFYKVYRAGVIYGQNHPKLSWISVKDDLPYNYPDLVYPLTGGSIEITQVVIVKDSNGDIGLSSMCGEDGNWEWATKGDWKYWMPVSALKSFNK